MKTLGMLGGMGPESTLDYYRLLIDMYRQKNPDGSYPPILINSINLQKGIRLIESNRLHELAKFLADEIAKLAHAGAEFGLISANTPHIVFDEIQQQSSLPLISIVEATCKAVRKRGLKKVGLFGTRFTMQADFFQKVFARNEIALVTPSSSQQDYIHDKYMNELLLGTFLPETRRGFLNIIERLKREDGIEGLILGGTELPLILREETDAGIHFFDTTRIHVNEAIDQMLA